MDNGSAASRRYSNIRSATTNNEGLWHCTENTRAESDPQQNSNGDGMCCLSRAKSCFAGVWVPLRESIAAAALCFVWCRNNRAGILTPLTNVTVFSENGDFFIRETTDNHIICNSMRKFSSRTDEAWLQHWLRFTFFHNNTNTSNNTWESAINRITPSISYYCKWVNYKKNQENTFCEYIFKLKTHNKIEPIPRIDFNLDKQWTKQQ